MDQVLNKAKEIYTLFSRMSLKENYKDYEFNEVYRIPFDKENDQDYKLKVCEFNDFKKSFSERYPNLNKIVDQEDCSESKKKRDRKDMFKSCDAISLGVNHIFKR